MNLTFNLLLFLFFTHETTLLSNVYGITIHVYVFAISLSLFSCVAVVRCFLTFFHLFCLVLLLRLSDSIPYYDIQNGFLSSFSYSHTHIVNFLLFISLWLTTTIFAILFFRHGMRSIHTIWNTFTNEMCKKSCIKHQKIPNLCFRYMLKQKKTATTTTTATKTNVQNRKWAMSVWRSYFSTLRFNSCCSRSSKIHTYFYYTWLYLLCFVAFFIGASCVCFRITCCVFT